MCIRFYKWNYGWDQLKELYIQKNKERAERTNQFCEFIVSIVNNIYGDGSKTEGDVQVDTGEGMDELSDEEIQMWKETLGEKEFALMYPGIE